MIKDCFLIDIAFVKDCIRAKRLLKAPIIGNKKVCLKEDQEDASTLPLDPKEQLECIELLDQEEKTKKSNDLLIGELQRLKDLTSATKDSKYRQIMYHKAIQSLKEYPDKIQNSQQVIHLPGIGPKIAQKIDEFLKFGRIQKVHVLEEWVSDKKRVLDLFLGIYGVAQETAHAWYEKGWRKLEDIDVTILTSGQKKGLKYYKEINSFIPRSEMIVYESLMRDIVFTVGSNLLESILVGSFRRGALESSDMDFLIVYEKSLPWTPMDTTEKIMEELKSRNHQWIPLDQGHSLVKGLFKHDSNTSVFRRMDILMVPREELGAALLYFTGNTDYNKMIRGVASKKGMTLNQHGLFVKDKNGKKGNLLASKTEKEILDVLGLPWLAPCDRK